MAFAFSDLAANAGTVDETVAIGEFNEVGGKEESAGAPAGDGLSFFRKVTAILYAIAC